MLQGKFKQGDRVVGIDTSGVAHPGVIETVWRRLGETVYGVLFDEINERLFVIEDDLRLESDYMGGERSPGRLQTLTGVGRRIITKFGVQEGSEVRRKGGLVLQPVAGRASA